MTTHIRVYSTSILILDQHENPMAEVKSIFLRNAVIIGSCHNTDSFMISGDMAAMNTRYLNDETIDVSAIKYNTPGEEYHFTELMITITKYGEIKLKGKPKPQTAKKLKPTDWFQEILTLSTAAASCQDEVMRENAIDVIKHAAINASDTEREDRSNTFDYYRCMYDSIACTSIYSDDERVQQLFQDAGYKG